MAEPTIQLGGGNWAGKSDNLLGYYKEGERFYKQDFTFNRTTTGTYTDSEGYIQEMPYNLALYSEEFNNAAYSLTESSITANAINSPIGTLTADKLVENTSNNLHRVGQGSISVISGEVYTFSFYVKAAERNELELQRINTSGTVFNSISVTTANLTNGTLSVGSNVTASSIENVGSGWYRISISLTAIANGSGGFNIGMQKNGSVFYQGDGVSGVYVWGFQAVKGTSAKTYFPTTTRLNMPRVDYLNNSNGSLILEPQRSNLVTYSSDFSEWDISTESTSTMTVTPNYTTAQNGLSASRLVATRPSTDFRSIISNYVTNTNTATKSVYIKNNNAGNVDINISDQAITVTDTWQRYELANNYPHATIGLRYAGAALSCDISIAGYQFELGSYATSYIPTSGSSVTRNADACSISNVADRIGQTEGTIYWEIDVKTTVATANENILNIDNGSGFGHTIYFSKSATGHLVGEMYVSGGLQASFTKTNITKGVHKMAMAYANNNTAFFVDGVQVGVTDTSCTVPSLSRIQLGNGALGASDCLSNDFKLYNTRLSDTELATLTT